MCSLQTGHYAFGRKGSHTCFRVPTYLTPAIDSRVRTYLTCTVRAQAPAFSILLANSTVSLGVSSRRILALTGTERFLLKVLDMVRSVRSSITQTRRTGCHWYLPEAGNIPGLLVYGNFVHLLQLQVSHSSITISYICDRVF